MSDNDCKAKVTEYIIRGEPNHLQEDPDVKENLRYHITSGPDITDDLWDLCASTFSENYGAWSREAPSQLGSWAVPGNAVVMSARRLKEQCLPDDANTTLITAVTGDDTLIAHCFVSQWTHYGDRVWWITQMVVWAEYRDQKKATRMLQALGLHFDIGRCPEVKDFIGILGSHPYAICAVLRVFGRGVESLPSGGNKERLTECAHLPLRISDCAPRMASSPVDYVRDATIKPDSLSAKTSFFIDHTVPNQALQTLLFGMNKQTRKPWRWYFGDLEEGCEFLCVLEYLSDASYDMRPKLVQQLRPSKTGERPKKESDLPPTSRRRAVRALRLRSPWMGPCNAQESIDYAQLNRIMRQTLARPRDARGNRAFKIDHPLERRIQEARAVLDSNTELIANTMAAKRIPNSIRPLHTKLFWTGRGLVRCPLPDHYSTWLDLNNWMKDRLVDGEEDPLQKRMEIFQAVHFLELLEETSDMSEEIEEPRSEQRRGDEKEVRLAMTQGKSMEKLRRVLSTPHQLFSRTMQRANDKAAKNVTRVPKSWLLSIPRMFPPLFQLQRINIPKASRPKQRTIPTQRTLLPSPQASKHALRDTLLYSASRPGSPRMSRSPEPSLGDMPASALPARVSPRKAVKVLASKKLER